MISETEEEETEDRETKYWEMENEGTKTTEEVSGRSTTDLSTTTTIISNEEDSEKPREEMGQQGMNTEENWHASETTSTQLRMTDFDAARQLEWNTYGGWTTNVSLIHDPELFNDTQLQ